MNIAGAEAYSAFIGRRLFDERSSLALRWLERLNELLTVERNDVFPSDQLLDHIPALIEQIARYVSAPAAEEIAANTSVIEKARELGALRYQQRASVHQVLREYEILGELLERFVDDETSRLDARPAPSACFDVLQRSNRAVRTLLRATVDTFITEYIAVIQERDERMRTFNRMASHELRSPIGTILFGAALLTADPSHDLERLARVAKTIRANAERLSWLVSNLERLTRLADPLDVPSQQFVEVQAIAGEVARQLGEMAASRGVEIRVAQGLPALLLDPASLELALLNLVSNAIKYSDRSKDAAFVEIALGDSDGGAGVTIVVRDNGLGIPAAAQREIFDRFVRAHPHLDRDLGVTGAGLGLSIAADCVHALGGAIRCHSIEGEGTTFTIDLPESAKAPSPSTGTSS